jgi:hypothetical protein
MTPRLILRFAAILARVIGFERGGDEPRSAICDYGLVPLAFVLGAEAPATIYVIATRLRDRGEWVVYNSQSDRNVAVGLARNRAATFGACP